MRLLVDVCLSPAWVPVLEAAGHDVVHWGSVGPFTAPDAELMEWARAEDRVVFTHDLDFTAILAASGGRGPSVVQLREQDVSPVRTGPAVVRALAQCAAMLEAGAVLTIDLRRARVRALPLSLPDR